MVKGREAAEEPGAPHQFRVWSSVWCVRACAHECACVCQSESVGECKIVSMCKRESMCVREQALGVCQREHEWVSVRVWVNVCARV